MVLTRVVDRLRDKQPVEMKAMLIAPWAVPVAQFSESANDDFDHNGIIAIS
jgi:hypothetical protein